jgi:hypothetical protein
MTHLSDTNKNKRLVCSFLFDYPAQCNKNISAEINRLKFYFFNFIFDFINHCMYKKVTNDEDSRLTK